MNLGGGEIILILLLIVPIAIASFAFWVWMLIDAIQNRRLDDGERVSWVLVIALLHFLGALIYLLAGKNKPAARKPV